MALPSAAETCHDRFDMLDRRRPGKEAANETAPGLEVVAAAEVHGVIFQRLPADDEAVRLRPLDGAVQPHRHATARPLEQRHGLRDGGFEGGVRAGLDGEFGDFVDHDGLSRFGGSYSASNNQPLPGRAR